MQANPSTTRRGRLFRSKWVLLAVLVLSVGVFIAWALPRSASGNDLRTLFDILHIEVRERLPYAIAMFSLAFLGAAAISAPVGAILTLAAGALFGPFLGTAVAWLASTIAATVSFFAARHLFAERLRRRFGDRLAPLQSGVADEGAFHLLKLRFSSSSLTRINLGMGLTRLPAWKFLLVSLLALLPGSFLFANLGAALAGIDSPGDVLGLPVLIAIALLVIVPRALRRLVHARIRFRTLALAVLALVLLVAGGLALRLQTRYAVAEEMDIAIKEYANNEYPEDPAMRSLHYGKYSGRKLTLVQKDDTHFDFILKPSDPSAAKIVFHDIDVGLMTPSLPDWTKDDPGLRRIALTDRQWNRQQVRFEPGSSRVEVSGGNGFEKANLFSAELAKNCLNAGLWEVLLFVKEKDNKALYYHGWFTFPLGHYQRVFEHNTGLPYWRHFYYLEHWFDPAGTLMRLDGLRQVEGEREVPVRFDRDQELIVAGEQLGKQHILTGENILTWQDFFDGRKIRFATFIPPGRYSVKHPWKNEYWRLDRFEKGIWREIVAPAGGKKLHELELVFSSSQWGGKCRCLVSGFDLAALPRLPVADYPKGLYMPMGIGVPPFFQTYDELEKSPPQESPYFSFLLDQNDRWINHHEVAIDGPVLHRDLRDPNVLHVYLLSYERHTLIGHFVVTLPPAGTGS